MLTPSIFRSNLFDDDDFFSFPAFPTFRNFDQDMNKMQKELYGHHAKAVMKTDVHEHDDHYEIDIDLPGFKKDEIQLDLQNGYLTIAAQKALEKNKEHEGKLIRQERYSGSMSRSFYVGEYVTEEDIKAKFTDGVLTLEVPRKEAPKVPEKKSIMIEG